MGQRQEKIIYSGFPRASGDEARGSENREGLFQQIEAARDLDDLSSAIGRLSEIVKQQRSRSEGDRLGRQEAVACLDRMRLVLAELERQELRTRGASKAMADRYSEIGSRSALFPATRGHDLRSVVGIGWDLLRKGSAQSMVHGETGREHHEHDHAGGRRRCSAAVPH